MLEKTLTRAATALVLATATLLMTAQGAAGIGAEQLCQKGRYDAAAKYKQCHDKALGVVFLTNDLASLQSSLSKCRVKYASAWLTLQRRAIGTGSTCDAPRFVDNGNGTVTDHLTGLDWEKKVSGAGVSSNGSTFKWPSASASFLAGINGGTGLNNNYDLASGFLCLALVCDWRLPTIAELQTIVAEPFPCTTSPCIASVFGPTAVGDYWSSTTLADNSSYAWGVFSGTGEVSYGLKSLSNLVRGVRGGL